MPDSGDVRPVRPAFARTHLHRRPVRGGAPHAAGRHRAADRRLRRDGRAEEGPQGDSAHRLFHQGLGRMRAGPAGAAPQLCHAAAAAAPRASVLRREPDGGTRPGRREGAVSRPHQGSGGAQPRRGGRGYRRRRLRSGARPAAQPRDPAGLAPAAADPPAHLVVRLQRAAPPAALRRHLRRLGDRASGRLDPRARVAGRDLPRLRTDRRRRNGRHHARLRPSGDGRGGGGARDGAARGQAEGAGGRRHPFRSRGGSRAERGGGAGPA